MTVLVTGAFGYLGGWVCQLLRGNGHQTVELGSRIPELWHVAVEARPFDAVVHLAWYSSAGDGQPELQQRCLDDTRKLVRRVSEIPLVGQPKFVFPSTLSVYGENGLRVCRETDWTSPQCAYTRAKATAEWAVQCLLPEDSTIFRFGSLMGRGAPGGRTKTDLVVNAAASEAYYRGYCEVWSPEAYKPVIHVRDAAELVVRAVEEDGWGGVWNACDSGRWTAGWIADEAARIAGAEVRVVGDANGSARRSCVADTTKLCGMLAEVPLPFRTVGQAIREFADYVPTPADRNTPWR